MDAGGDARCIAGRDHSLDGCDHYRVVARIGTQGEGQVVRTNKAHIHTRHGGDFLNPLNGLPPLDLKDDQNLLILKVGELPQDHLCVVTVPLEGGAAPRSHWWVFY